MNKKIQFTLIDDQGYELEVALPGKFRVCSRCNGEGSHVNPNIDGNGISPEEFDEDPDFSESYFAGHYDVRCERCHGARVELELDEEALTPEQRAQWERHQAIEEEAYRDYQSEAWLRRAESGERW